LPAVLGGLLLLFVVLLLLLLLHPPLAVTGGLFELFCDVLQSYEIVGRAAVVGPVGDWLHPITTVAATNTAMRSAFMDRLL